MIDHFRVGRLLARGGMGEVYLARDTKLGRRAALKIVSAEHLESEAAVHSFLFEARTTAKFSHPNIVTIHAVGEHEGRPYVALEYVEGQNLRERMFDRPPGLPEALRIALAVAGALQEAHRNGVLHLDLKPENVVIPIDGRVRVVDFGLAKTFHAEGEDDDDDDDDEPPSTGPVWGTPSYVAPEQWRYKPPTAATDVWALGVIIYELCAGRVPFPQEPTLAKGRAICSVELAPRVDEHVEVPRSLADLVAACLNKDPADRPSAETVAEAIENLLRELRPGAGVGDRSPFRGLQAFTSEHAALFFGRDAEVAALVERLRHQPVLTVVGPSGAGKSSFVQAGVVPRLREQGRWLVVRIRPGNRPFFTLAERVQRPERGEASPSAAAVLDEVEKLAKRLRRSPHLLGLKLRALAEEEGVKVLLVVEQLEELFTLLDDAGVRAKFMQAVCSAADDAGDPVRVILTVRDDFLGRLATGPEAREALSQVMVIESLDEVALTDVLVKPVAAVGYRFEDDELIHEMTEAVRGEPGSLPLLQFAAEQLWKDRNRDAKVLRRSTYEAMGGVEGALARHADGTLDGLSAKERQLARALLLRLVTPERTRRVLARSEALEGFGSEAEGVLERLARARLIATINPRGSASGPALELVHESLIRKWGTLARWLDESREEHAFLAEVGQAAELWRKRGRRPDELWQGDALADAERIARRAADLPPPAAEFLEASGHHARRLLRRRQMIVVGLVAGLVTIAAVAVGVALWVADKGREAETQRDLAQQQRAEALRAAARAALQRGGVLEARARLRTALEAQDSPGARALWWQLSADPRHWVKQLGALVYSVDYAADGRFVVAGCQDQAAYVIDVESGETTVLRGSDDQIFAVAISPDGETVAGGSWSGQINVWDRKTGIRRRVLKGHEGGVQSMRWSPDGSRLASGASDNSVRIWQMSSGKSERRIDIEAKVDSVAFSPQADRLVVGAGSTLTIWDVETGTQVAKRVGADQVQAVAWSGDGRYIASGGNDQVVHLWDAQLRAEARGLAGHAGGIRSVQFDAEGKRLVSASYDRTVRVWDVGTGQVQRTMSSHQAGVEEAAFSPDATRVVSVARDHTVRLWGVEAPLRRTVEAGHAAAVYAIDWSPDGRLIVSASSDKTLILWDASTGDEVKRLVGHTDGVDSARFSPDGRSVASGSVDLTVRLWDVESGAERRVLTGFTGRVANLAFDRDGTRLAAVGRDSTARVYDVASGTELAGWSALEGAVFGVDWSRDGRLLATGGVDKWVKLWDTRSWALRRSLPGNEAGVHGVRFIDNGARVASGGLDGYVRIWAVDGGPPQLLGPHEGRVYWIDHDPVHDRLGAPTSDGTVTIWDLAAGTNLAVLRGHGDEVNAIRFSQDGARAVTGSDDGTVRVWDAATGVPLWHAPLLLGGPARLFSHRGATSLATGEPVEPPSTQWAEAVRTRARVAHASPETATLCLLTHDGHVELWDMKADARRSGPETTGAQQVVALAGGCGIAEAEGVAIATAGAEVRSIPLDEPPTALHPDDAGLLVASGTKALALGPDGAVKDEYEVGLGVVAVARIADALVVAYAEGNVEVRTPSRTLSLELTPASPAVAIERGPADTVAVGHANGAVGLWSLLDGSRLGLGRIHGRVTHLLLEDQKLYATTDLGHHLVWDLAVLYRDYCEVMREVWERVPIIWVSGAAWAQPPDPAHPCAPPITSSSVPTQR